MFGFDMGQARFYFLIYFIEVYVLFIIKVSMGSEKSIKFINNRFL